jgi:hypothetical protein
MKEILSEQWFVTGHPLPQPVAQKEVFVGHRKKLKGKTTNSKLVSILCGRCRTEGVCGEVKANSSIRDFGNTCAKVCDTASWRGLESCGLLNISCIPNYPRFHNPSLFLVI